ncbi:MAG: flagellar motor protein MotB [Elusimicrobia bacterium]|nr:flagellar motor protein MotB [Elusimicrobiota bacterium]
MPMRAPKGFIDETDPKVAKVGHPAPAWVVCYADLMTELVCFFVILYALSAALNKNVQNAAQQVKEMMDKGQMKGEVKIDKEGLKISIEEQGGASFFGVGAAEPTPEIDGKLALLTPAIAKLAVDHEILVEGHTDGQAIHNDYFDSNWELSTARATSVARLLIEKYRMPAANLGAVGYGGNRPIATNDTPEGRAKNRRVVIFVKSGTIPKKTDKDGRALPEDKPGEIKPAEAPAPAPAASRENPESPSASPAAE